MDSSDTGLLLVLMIVLLLTLGFFSLMETAIAESHRSKLEKMQEDGNTDAEKVLELLEQDDRMLSLSQIGITMSSILIGVCTGVLLAPMAAKLLPIPHAQTLSLVISVLVITCLALLLGEFLPKKTAMQKPEAMLLKYHGIMRLLARVTRPFVSLLSGAANMILLIFGINPHAADTVTEDEVKDLIEQGTEDGTFEKTEHDFGKINEADGRVSVVFSFKNEGMTPLVLSNVRASIFPVGRDSLDDFCGVLYAKDLLNATLAHEVLDLSQYIRKPLFIPRSMETFRVLKQFRTTGIHEAMVLDEYGGVIGFLTMDDILQEIAGESFAAHEEETAQLTVRDENSWLVDGLYDIDDFKAKFSIEELPDEDHDHYQTMGGFLTSYFGYIPKAGERIDWQDFTFEVVDMDGARIDKIMITKKSAEETVVATE